ncbi:hypothetical protein ACKC9G_14470 [Pokkaliibacter sp. CJK22405]|uniref:hypothetical protein n=1 Tax=Pokkaliibacter sp. CJK22405 TaxID=3384615 RepID=UPI003985339D
MGEKIPYYSTPAHQGKKDFELLGIPQKLPAFTAEWSTYVEGWSTIARVGNPWSNLNDAPRDNYYNPLETPYGDVNAIVPWVPYPQRMVTFFSHDGAQYNPQLKRKLTEEELYYLADHGQITLDGTTFALYQADPASESSTLLQIPRNQCCHIDWTGPYVDYEPLGPRGWLDEYCEWSIEHNDSGVAGQQGKMQAITFTCENPAYYLALWDFDPNIVLRLYQAYIDKAAKLEDLYLKDSDGNTVTDPTTGKPAYDTTNLWNRGTQRVAGKFGGAMHLTSGPNTLSAEIYLAAAASMQRDEKYCISAQALLCAAEYGMVARNSDPTIGYNANMAAMKGPICLTDPVGLYIQQPESFDSWKGPQGQDLSQYWEVCRGSAGTGPDGSDQILQARFAIPQSAGFTIEDITINGVPVKYAGQVAQQLRVALSATARAEDNYDPVILDRVQDRIKDPQPWPVQLMSEALFNGNSASDLPTRLMAGSSYTFILTTQCANRDTTPANARIEFDNPDISVSVSAIEFDCPQAPDQLDRRPTEQFTLTISIKENATPGWVSLRVLNPDEGTSPSAEDHPWAQGMARILSS